MITALGYPSNLILTTKACGGKKTTKGGGKKGK